MINKLVRISLAVASFRSRNGDVGARRQPSYEWKLRNRRLHWLDISAETHHLSECATYPLVPAVLLLTMGTYAAYFGPVGDTATIRRMIATDAWMLQYTLSISSWLIRSAAHRTIFQVQFGTAQFSAHAILAWRLAGSEFTISDMSTATGQTELLSFTFRNDPAYWFLDNVSVTLSGRRNDS